MWSVIAQLVTASGIVSVLVVYLLDRSSIISSQKRRLRGWIQGLSIILIQIEEASNPIEDTKKMTWWAENVLQSASDCFRVLTKEMYSKFETLLLRAWSQDVFSLQESSSKLDSEKIACIKQLIEELINELS